MEKIKDSGKKEHFASGYQRDSRDNKGRWDLLPYYGLQEVAQHYEAGGKKYGDNNWKNGCPLNRYLDSAARHISKAIGGMEDENHAAAAVWNLLCFIETRKRIQLGMLPPELDDVEKTGEKYTEGLPK